MERGYNPSLDGLRAVAAFTVLLHHCDTRLFTSGFLGVDIFFVLSGFLITRLLRDDADLAKFYGRRALRLAPAFLFMLTAYLVAAPLLWPGHNHARDAALAGLYLSDIAVPAFGYPVYLGHTWSLAVEAQFYLLWPFVLPFIRKRPVLILSLLYVALTLWRGAWSGDWAQGYYRPDTHATGLVLGALVSFLPWRSPYLAHLGAAALGAAFLLSIKETPQSLLFGISLAELGSAFVILGVLSGQGVLAGVLASPPLRWLGVLSYGIYLWHYPISRALKDVLPLPATIAIVAIASTALAALSYYTVERWARRRAWLKPALA